MIEIWKTIEGFQNYAVSNMGRVKRLTSRTCAKAGTVLKQANRNGYPSVNLCANGSKKSHSVHVLVAEAFIGSRPQGCTVNHKDADRTNNLVSNLEWVTQSRNVKHAYELGLRDARGEGNGQAKLTEQDVIVLRRQAKGAPRGFFAEQARRLGVSDTTVRDAVFGRTWPHVTENP